MMAPFRGCAGIAPCFEDAVCRFCKGEDARRRIARYSVSPTGPPPA